MTINAVTLMNAKTADVKLLELCMSYVQYEPTYEFR